MASVGFLASPFPYVLKFIVIIHYILIAIMAIGIGECLTLMKSTIARFIGVTALIVAVGLIFITNTMAWKSTVVFRGVASEVSPDEISAANFLKSRYNNNVFLVSDPATQAILEPLTGIDSQGGAYMSEATRTVLLNALKKNDIQGLKAVHQGKILLAVNARTMKWLTTTRADQMSIAFNIWRPEGLSMNDEIVISQWQKQFSLTEVYKNPSMVIFIL